MMRTFMRVMPAALILASLTAAPAGAAVMGSTTTTGDTGVITFNVNSSPHVLGQVRDNVQLTNGARPTSFEIKDGQMTIEFENARPGTVEAILPDDLAAGIVGTGSGTAAGDGGGIASAPVLAGGVALAIGGGTFGGLIAAGVIDTNGDEPIPQIPASGTGSVQ